MSKSRISTGFWLLLLFTALISETSAALVDSQIQVTQKSGLFTFNVSLKSTEKIKLDFKLASQVVLNKYSGLHLQLESDGTKDLSLPAGASATLEYQISYASESAFYLTSDDAWTPVLQNNADLRVEQTFSASAQLLPGFEMIDTATGKNEGEFDLVLCQCQKYSSPDHRLNVLLLNDEPALAKSILADLQKYLAQYEKDFGPYPYDQFSVVECNQEVGYAFPKMTWLGTQLLHFPFILQTSLPHELLHSWWGNGVFVDYAKGNWCEGMTTLGSDYGWLSDSDKKLYRLKAITDYMDYAESKTEIPLSKFVTRGEDRSLQAIGYDKSMMVFLMAEEQVGADTFKLAQKEFYGKFRYQKASYEDFFVILSQISGVDFSAYANFWINNLGILPKNFATLSWQSSANTLAVHADTKVLPQIPGMNLTFKLQMNDHSLKSLDIGVAPDGQGLVKNNLSSLGHPAAYAFDPDFKLFRELDQNEKPVSFSQSFSATELKVISADASFPQTVAAAFPKAKVSIVTSPIDYSLEQVVFISAGEAAQYPEISSVLQNKNISFASGQFIFNGQSFSTEDHSLLFSFRIKQSIFVVLDLGVSQTPLRWLQRWSHYGAKDYLVLNSTGADIQGLWQESEYHPL